MPAKKDPLDKELHKKVATRLFNYVWTLIEKKQRTQQEVDEMINGAHASQYHWSKAGTAKNLSIGEWQISRIYAILGRAEPSLYHANRNLEICKQNDLRDFYLAYAYEALARACAVAGNRREARRYLEQARRAGKEIEEKEDRELLYRDLETIRFS